jgi:hypothetical protein
MAARIGAPQRRLVCWTRSRLTAPYDAAWENDIHELLDDSERIRD